ncbi:Predicted dehydrogenase [Ceraceosorus bombacis]|uniref:Predicted dehydrogenase n=1 Tax=Ceraceosorus bombacis TaxID=401625 RepID=A0A0P1BSM4_9BASI|nr:Predicted dehydrogenase [Ceraceosorus bombacis]
MSVAHPTASAAATEAAFLAANLGTPEWITSLFALFGLDVPVWLTPLLTFIAFLAPIPILILFRSRSRPRQTHIPPYRERVVILGASSGVGKELALSYAERGCRQLLLVARRADELERVRAECDVIRLKGEEWEMSDEAPGYKERGSLKTLSLAADCSKAEQVDKIKQTVLDAFGGLDTVHLLFGLSALRPVLGIADIDPIRKGSSSLRNGSLGSSQEPEYASLAGLEAVRFATNRINEVNVTATALCATALLPILQLTSSAPSFVLLSSIAALVPAPTRALYGSSKAAQLLFFQSLALEAQSHAQSTRRLRNEAASNQTMGSKKRASVSFLAILPGTIKTDFRSSAVDGDPTSAGAFDASHPSQGEKGAKDVLLPKEVADLTILKTDQYATGEVALPSKYKHSRLARALVPGLLGRLAHKKYGY